MGNEADTLIEVGSSTARRSAAAAGARLCLVIIGEGLDATVPLPDEGRVGIGRSQDADIRIDHRSVSRHHAVLAVGERLTIEDRASANGTRVRGQAIPRNTPVTIALGEPIDVGSVMVVVQQRTAPAPQRHIWAHGYFEARLEEECARAARGDGRLAVLRLHFGRADAAVEAVLGRLLRAMDVLGYYGPAEYEVLVPDSAPDQVAALVETLQRALGDAAVRIGVAQYPEDARDPYSLLARASAGALGEPPATAQAGPILVADAAMQNLDRVVQRIAAGTISVLITGETGVGKEVLAERLHRLSPRADRPFLRLNCAALSETLLESELFGHERGAFTGAVQTKEGLLETAQGGTVFLDEIGELPMSMQVKLLRVIEERQVLRVGALRPRPIDVRFLSATHRDLEAEIARGAFRQDLYFRLNGIALVIPPLRQRTGEIPGLARHFLQQAAARNGRDAPPAISPEALALLLAHQWPGNIRELRNVMERAQLLCGDDDVRVEHLPAEKMRDPRPTTPPPLPPPEVDDDATDDEPLPVARGGADERQRIIDALAQAGGNQTEAAKLLGVSRRTLINRVIAFDLPRPRKK